MLSFCFMCVCMTQDWLAFLLSQQSLESQFDRKGKVCSSLFLQSSALIRVFSTNYQWSCWVYICSPHCDLIDKCIGVFSSLPALALLMLTVANKWLLGNSSVDTWPFWCDSSNGHPPAVIALGSVIGSRSLAYLHEEVHTSSLLAC